MEAKTEIYKRYANQKRKEVIFKECDLVSIHLRKERFPKERKSKLMHRIYGPFQILKKINDNAYQLDLQGKYDISLSFNVSDLSPFLVDDPDLWTNPFEEGGNDVLSLWISPWNKTSMKIRMSGTFQPRSTLPTVPDRLTEPCTGSIRVRP